MYTIHSLIPSIWKVLLFKACVGGWTIHDIVNNPRSTKRWVMKNLLPIYILQSSSSPPTVRNATVVLSFFFFFPFFLPLAPSLPLFTHSFCPCSPSLATPSFLSVSYPGKHPRPSLSLEYIRNSHLGEVGKNSHLCLGRSLFPPSCADLILAGFLNIE